MADFETRVCPTCRRPMDKSMMEALRTVEQRNEFTITGMCADCQRNIYDAAPGEERSTSRGGEVTGSINWKEVK